jgi:hypothetical protein
MVNDASHYALQIPEHFGRRYAKRREAPIRNYLVFALVTLRLITPIVSLPIHFDREPRFEAGEIQRERMQRKLPTKLEPSGTPPKLAPKHRFWRAHLTPQLTCALYRLDWG